MLQLTSLILAGASPLAYFLPLTNLFCWSVVAMLASRRDQLARG